MGYLPRSSFRLLLFSLLILIIIIVVASSLVNNSLENSKGKIEQNLSSLLNQKLSIESISFLPPNLIILKNLSIHETGQQRQSCPLFIERVKCRFSLLLLISRRDIIITKIDFNKPNIDFPFIKENIKAIIEILNSLTQEYTLNMLIEKARLNIPNKGSPMRWIILDATSTIKPDKSFFSSGSIGLESFFAINNLNRVGFIPKITSSDYSLQLFPTKDGLIIENFEFKSLQFYVKLWGALVKNVLKLNGHLSVSNLFGDDELTTSTYSVMDKLKKILLNRGKDHSRLMDTSIYDLNIYDLDCVVKLDLPSIYIEDLTFSLKNMPLRLEGTILLQPPHTLDLQFSSFPNQTPKVRLSNPERFDMNAVGAIEKGKFSGKLGIDFLRRTKSKEYLESVETTFQDLTFSSTRHEKMRMSFKEATLAYTSGSNLYDIYLKDFNALFDVENNMIRFFKVDSIIYDGILDGKGVSDITQIPFRNSFDIKIKDVSANRLHGLLPYGSKTFGIFSSLIHYKSHPSSKLTGELLISDGLLDNVLFLIFFDIFLKSLLLIK